MQQILSLGSWVSLPNEVRWRIRNIFNIPRSGVSDVVDFRIVSDGTTHEDIKVLTAPKMQEYLGTKEQDFHRLFDLVVARVIDQMSNPKDMIEVHSDSPVNITIETPVEIKKRKYTRHAKK